MELPDGERDRFAVKPGDLLVCEGGEIGRCAIWQQDAGYMAYQKALHRIRPGDLLNVRYLRYLLEHLASNGTLARLSTGSTIAHLPQQQLRRVPVPLAPVEEQRRIVTTLDDLLSRLASAESQIGVANGRADALRKQSLFRALARQPGWQVAPIEHWLDLSIGGLWGQPPGTDEVDVRVIRVTELKRWGRLEPTTAAVRSISLKQLAGRQLLEGDLLLEKSGGGPKTPVGRVGLVTTPPEGTICANFMQLLRPDPRLVLPRFLHLALNALHISGATAGMQKASTNIRNLKASEYLRTEIAIPDLQEQEKVVSVVEEELAAADRLEASVTRARSHSAQLRSSLLSAAFSGGLS